MKKIGLVDYFISEWHANNYPGWIRDLCKSSGLDYEIAYAYAELDVSPVTGECTDEWCARMGIARCDSIDELCEKSDYIIILAPSNPETHLRLAEGVLKYGKRTYIDKTFAPDYPTARKIFELSKKWGAPFFSTSALRYATELEAFSGADQLLITGGGSNLREYSIHQIEIAVSLFKCAPLELKYENQGFQSVTRVKFEEGKCATLVYSPSMPFSLCAEFPKGVKKEECGEFSDLYREITSDFFAGLMKDILNFFETGEISFDPAETVNAMKIRGALISAMENPGEIIKC